MKNVILKNWLKIASVSAVALSVNFPNELQASDDGFYYENTIRVMNSTNYRVKVAVAYEGGQVTLGKVYPWGDINFDLPGALHGVNSPIRVIWKAILHKNRSCVYRKGYHTYVNLVDDFFGRHIDAG